MCIIALKPEKKLLTRSALSIMWDNNPDGAGFMYADSGKVIIVKGLMTLDALWAAMQAAGPLRKMVIHFRIKTHGAISPELTHPFWIQKDKLGMVHNGVIRPLVNETSDAESDTAVFARKFGAAYANPMVAIKHEFHRDMLEAYIGYSKMVFMDETGATIILNEQLGEWHQNVWYSNDRYKAEKPSKKSYGSYASAESMGDTRFPWELGKFEQNDRVAIQQRLDEAFKYHPRTDRASANRVVHVTAKNKGSENATRRQRPLLGLPSTHGVDSRWSKRSE